MGEAGAAEVEMAVGEAWAAWALGVEELVRVDVAVELAVAEAAATHRWE